MTEEGNQQVDPQNTASSSSECPVSDSCFGYQLWCCLATKKRDGTFVRCHRFATMQSKLTRRLIRLAVSKSLPVFHNKEISHNFLCSFHGRLIVEERAFDQDFYSRDFSGYEEDPSKDSNEFPFATNSSQKDARYQKETTIMYVSSDDEIADVPGKPKSTSSKSDENKSADKAKDASLECANFSTLSAVAIRRYKKFFKLPNRSGANSKQQLLDGIEEHFKGLPVDISETVAFFMYTVKGKRNKLDYPNEELGPRKQLRSDT